MDKAAKVGMARGKGMERTFGSGEMGEMAEMGGTGAENQSDEGTARNTG